MSREAAWARTSCCSGAGLAGAALLGVLAGAQVDAVFLRRLPEALEASAYSAAPSLAAKLRPLGDFERLALALGSARG